MTPAELRAAAIRRQEELKAQPCEVCGEPVGDVRLFEAAVFGAAGDVMPPPICSPCMKSARSASRNGS